MYLFVVTNNKYLPFFYSFQENVVTIKPKTCTFIYKRAGSGCGVFATRKTATRKTGPITDG
jgi:hypothetical protein